MTSEAGYRVLVTGATGVMGGALATLLAGDPRFEVHLGVRDPLAGERLARILSEQSKRAIAVHAIDADHPDAGLLARIGMQLVIDAAGPFEMRSGLLARAAILRQAHYVDIADARGHISAIETRDAEAREAGVLAVSGAGLTPGLTSLLIAEHRPRFSEIADLTVGIAEPGGDGLGPASRGALLAGLNVPLPTVRCGAPTTTRSGRGLVHAPLGSRLRLWTTADLPELMTAPATLPALKNLRTLRSGPLGAGQRALAMLAGARNWLPGRDPVRFINVLDMERRFDRFAAREGGALVEMRGRGLDGGPLTIRHAITVGRDGFAMLAVSPAVALASDLAGKAVTRSGSAIAHQALSLVRLQAQWQALGLDVSDVATEREAD
ncbi:MAG: saccharopine dehydrogenase NADP-binding domain-containing protein [Pseudomonadota bacterium]